MYGKLGWDCQLGREARLHDIERAGDYDPELMREVQRLHREREYLTSQLAFAIGEDIATIRQEMRVAMGQDPADIKDHDTA